MIKNEYNIYYMNIRFCIVSGTKYRKTSIEYKNMTCTYIHYNKSDYYYIV